MEACRRDQPHLIEQVLNEMEEKTNEQVAHFFNELTDSMGNHALHICAQYGSCTCLLCHFFNANVSGKLTLLFWLDDTMDALFDIQFFECDPLTRLDKDTPLHIAVRYANDKDAELGEAMIKMMCEAGCDPRVRNKHGQKPAELVFNNNEIKKTLQQTEYIMAEGIQNTGNGADSDGGEASDSD